MPVQLNSSSLEAYPLSEPDLRRAIYIAAGMACFLPPFVGGTLMTVAGYYPFPQFYQIFFSFSGLYMLLVTLLGFYGARRLRQAVTALPDSPPAQMAARARALFRTLPWSIAGFVIVYSIGGALVADANLEYLQLRSPYTWREHFYTVGGLLPAVLITLFPIYFFLLDKLGLYLAPRGVQESASPLGLRIVLLGLVTPVLIDSLLLSYVANRASQLTVPALVLWAVLIVVAALGSWMAWRSLQQSLRPLRSLLANGGRQEGNLLALSLDELGALTKRLSALLDEQGRIAEALQREKRFSETVLQSAGILLVVLDREGRIRQFNRASEKLSGYTFAEIEGCFPWDTFLPPEEAGRIRSQAFEGGMEDLARQPAGSIATYTNYWEHKNGEQHLIEWSNTLVRDSKNDPSYMIAVGQDITQRVAMERETRRIKDLLQFIIDASPDWIFAKDLSHRFVMVNRAFAAALDRQPREMIGKLDSELWPQRNSADAVRTMHALHHDDRRAFAGETVRKPQETVNLDVGRPRVFESFKGPLRDADNNIIGVFSYSRDVTEHLVAEENLRQSNQLLNAVLDTTPVMIAYLDCQLNFVRVNRAYAAADHKTPDFFPGKNHFVLFPNAENEEIFRQVLRSGEAYCVQAKPFEYEHNPERGVSHWDWTLTPIKGDDDRVSGLVLSLQNVTERIQSLEAIQSNERELQKINESLELRVQERARQLQDASQMNEQILAAAPVAIAAFRADGQCVFSNKVAAKMFGDAAQELPQRNFNSLASWRDSGLLEAATHTLHSGDSLRREICIAAPDGHKVWLECTIACFNRGGESHLLVMAGDTTQRRLAEEESLHAREAAERASRAKSEFLSRMSHELRTPMNAILGFSQVLEEENLQSEQLEYVGEIRRAGNYLLNLINELLDLSRIEAGRMITVLQPVDVSEVVRDALQIVQPMLQADNISLETHCAGEHVVLADVTRIRQILLNLLSNAIKYNRRNGHVSVRCQAADRRRLRLSVTDTGHGIAADKIGQLFRPFERLGAEFTGIEGTGIGLALAWQLAELMGGTLGVDSTPGEGSTFWLELPRAESAASQAQSINRGGTKTPAESTILYVEDNAANMRVVEAIFRKHEHIRLLTASNGEHGLELARRYHPAAVLLDIQLPGIDGYAVLQALRDDPQTRDIPVLALSAEAMPLDIEQGLRAGFRYYLTKPVQIEELMRALDTVLATSV